MLILTRRIGESIIIGEKGLRITILSIHAGQTRVGFDAPNHVKILRKEVWEKDQAERQRRGKP